jgi:hypothetical protein
MRQPVIVQSLVEEPVHLLGTLFHERKAVALVPIYEDPQILFIGAMRFPTHARLTLWIYRSLVPFCLFKAHTVNVIHEQPESFRCVFILSW